MEQREPSTRTPDSTQLRLIPRSPDLPTLTQATESSIASQFFPTHFPPATSFQGGKLRSRTSNKLLVGSKPGYGSDLPQPAYHSPRKREEKLLSMGTKAAWLGPRGACPARIFGKITGITSSARGKNNPGNRLQLQLVTAGCATAG